MELGGSSRKKKETDDDELFRVIHKVPSGHGSYVKAKYAQLVEKNLEVAIVWFWKAINEGDKMESALKDMAVVMKQLDRGQEAIEAIKSFRHLCPKKSQESLDNLLIDLYKKCGKVDEQIALLKQKLRLIYKGETFNGKPTKKARSHGKKLHVSVKQEISRLLGNIGWAYMQKPNYMAAEAVYRKAQMIDSDVNKACNLGLCLIKQARYVEARTILEEVLQGRVVGSEDIRAKNRAKELLLEIEPQDLPMSLPSPLGFTQEDDFADLVDEIDRLLEEWNPLRTKRLPIFEEISHINLTANCSNQTIILSRR
ncbi:protein SULFUR DEFICIENCY-INDUCED 1-like [Impatiens glandulifera]|uniref:protein SULFUR DEFICIENCY-INDUCED 1-like n=1 Tax=Impatiens glandulifera TaxID=253017 RepID=UPI001FB186BA|nr:protein SULFUR DEFICIENCY-INDUCED 1-like [Impatiens glandulifera]